MEVIQYNKGNSNNSKEYVEYIINNIGEAIVQRKLKHDFNALNQSIENVKNEIDELSEKIGYERTVQALKSIIETGGKND